jgi:hypothetical protein
MSTITPAQAHALKFECVPWIHGVGNSYGYHPSLAAGIIFVLLFGLSLLGHVGQAVRTRQSMFILCALGATSKWDAMKREEMEMKLEQTS